MCALVIINHEDNLAVQHSIWEQEAMKIMHVVIFVVTKHLVSFLSHPSLSYNEPSTTAVVS
jgi:hypothetical protein